MLQPQIKGMIDDLGDLAEKVGADERAGFSNDDRSRPPERQPHHPVRLLRNPHSCSSRYRCSLVDIIAFCERWCER